MRQGYSVFGGLLLAPPSASISETFAKSYLEPYLKPFTEPFSISPISHIVNCFTHINTLLSLWHPAKAGDSRKDKIGF